MGPFVTISGAPVDATLVIDALVAKIGELALENASLRAQVASWSSLAHAQVVDGAPGPQRASEGPGGANGGPVETEAVRSASRSLP